MSCISISSLLKVHWYLNLDHFHIWPSFYKTGNSSTEHIFFSLQSSSVFCCLIQCYNYNSPAIHNKKSLKITINDSVRMQHLNTVNEWKVSSWYIANFWLVTEETYRLAYTHAIVGFYCEALNKKQEREVKI